MLERLEREIGTHGEAEVEIRKRMGIEDFDDEFTQNPEIAKVKFQ